MSTTKKKQRHTFLSVGKCVALSSLVDGTCKFRREFDVCDRNQNSIAGCRHSSARCNLRAEFSRINRNTEEKHTQPQYKHLPNYMDLVPIYAIRIMLVCQDRFQPNCLHVIFFCSLDYWTIPRRIRR